MKKLFSLFVASVVCCVQLVAATISPIELKCEYERSPLLERQNPRLQWINSNPKLQQGARQTAYRIRVATSPDGFDKAVWDTGKVLSSQSAFVRYEGAPLRSRTSYWWQVMVWDENGEPSAWSEPAQWHMGLLSDDEWQGKWIGAPWQGEQSYDSRGTMEFDAAPLLRKEFSVKKGLKSARYYQLQLIKGTRMAREYEEHPEWFHLYEADEYIELAIDYVERIPQHVVIERFISQSPRTLLIAPDWGMKNHEFVDRLRRRMAERNTWQGKAIEQMNN